MKSRRLQYWLLLGLVVVAVGLIGSGIYTLYRYLTRPTMERSGGTILVYEVDPESGPEVRAEDLVKALERRLDPNGHNGIVVRLVDDDRVEISIPRGGDHEAQLREAKDLIRQVGKLEFRILANMRDDSQGIEAVRKFIEATNDPQVAKNNRLAHQEDLDRRAQQGSTPPSSMTLEGKTAFPWATPSGNGEATYSWVELGRGSLKLLGLDHEAENDPIRNQRWNEVREAREQGRVVFLNDVGQTVLFSRHCVNLRMPEAERAKKRFEYFFLTRDPKPGERITGEYLTVANAGKDMRGEPAVDFQFSKLGGDLFYALTSQNVPAQQFFRFIAIILDDEILSAPRLNEAIRSRGQITGDFTEQEVNRMAQVLRAGALPARLKPLPVSESRVEPKK